MSIITIDRAVVQQAMDAMLNFNDDISDEMFESIRSLRAALAHRDARQIEQAPVLLQALQALVRVCQRMDLEHQAERPSEAEYQQAIRQGCEALAAVEACA